MLVRTLTGQFANIADQVTTLVAISSNQASYSSTDNIALQKTMGRKILAAAGPNGLLAVLDELKADLSKPHHKFLTKIWLPIIEPEVRGGSKSYSINQDYGPANSDVIAFEHEWGAGTYSRCQMAMVAALGYNRVCLSRLSITHMQAQGIRPAMADAFLALVQEKPRQNLAG